MVSAGFSRFQFREAFVDSNINDCTHKLHVPDEEQSQNKIEDIPSCVQETDAGELVALRGQFSINACCQNVLTAAFKQQKTLKADTPT